MYAGLVKRFGQTVVLHVNGIDIIVTTHNLKILDRMQFAAFGIDPKLKKVVALKSMQHFQLLSHLSPKLSFVIQVH